MVSIDNIKLDTAAMDGGVWKSDPWGLGFRLLIASGRGREFTAAYREALRVREKDEEAFQKTLNELLARYILKGWEGLDGPDGEPLPYSYEQALAFMTSPETVHIRELVDGVGGELAEYFVKSKAEAGKG